jgi:hypothetical protein
LPCQHQRKEEYSGLSAHLAIFEQPFVPKQHGSPTHHFQQSENQHVQFLSEDDSARLIVEHFQSVEQSSYVGMAMLPDNLLDIVEENRTGELHEVPVNDRASMQFYLPHTLKRF